MIFELGSGNSSKETVRYNEETDTVQIFNGIDWIDWKAGEQSRIDVYKSFPNNAAWDFYNQNGTCSVSVADGNFIISTTRTDSQVDKFHYLWSKELVDLSKFNKLKLSGYCPIKMTVGLCSASGKTTPDILLAELSGGGAAAPRFAEVDLSKYQDKYYLYVKVQTYTNANTPHVFNEFAFL